MSLGTFASQRGTALMEFALAWPIVLLLVLGAVQLAVWESEAAAAHDAALAGARAGTVVGAGVDTAARVAIHAMSASLVGVTASVWCPRDVAPRPTLWVCAADLRTAVQVDVGGFVPAVVPVISGGGIPIRAHVVLDKEDFRR
jgi:Flp pilus assembly protein TadG